MNQTGAIVQTLPPVSSNTMQFISVDGISFGTNLASAETLGLDPAQLCDYNGNPLGATGQWNLLGLASVQPGAAPSYILVDPTTGRWAEVAVQANGAINFQNYGQNGDTRVVGIYIDPLVTAGIVAAGSPDDLQVRFLSDVENNNLNLLGKCVRPGKRRHGSHVRGDELARCLSQGYFAYRWQYPVCQLRHRGAAIAMGSEPGDSNGDFQRLAISRVNRRPGWPKRYFMRPFHPAR